MADDLNQNAEFAGKHKDEEDPILIAQRYLNIYHQIHIFNDVRQKEFDDSLLALPSDIRILLSTLPGGSLLLEHIAEVEEKRGIVPITDLSSHEKYKLNKKGRKSQQDAIDEEKEEKDFVNQTGNINISNNVLKMLKRSEEKHDKDMQALTQAFLQSQENMTNMLKEVLVETKSQTTYTQPPTPHLEVSGNRSYTLGTRVQPQPAPSKPRFFGFTRRLFSHKASHDQEDMPQALNPFVDNTPVSLDDVTDTPVALDGEVNTESKPDKILEEKEDFSVDTTSPVKDTPIEDTPIESGDDSEWDWEYVDEDENTVDDASDDEWEYVEEHIDETQDNISDDYEWEYVEEPVVDEASEQTEQISDTSGTESTEETSVEDAFADNGNQDLSEKGSETFEYPLETPIASENLSVEGFDMTDQNFEFSTPEEALPHENNLNEQVEVFNNDLSYESTDPLQESGTLNYAADGTSATEDVASENDTNIENTETSNEMDELFDQFLEAGEDANKQDLLEHEEGQDRILDAFLNEEDVGSETSNTSMAGIETEESEAIQQTSHPKNNRKKKKEQKE